MNLAALLRRALLVSSLIGGFLSAAEPVLEIAGPDGLRLSPGTASNVKVWGDFEPAQAAVPRGLIGVRAVAAGERHALALKHDGTVAIWGYVYNNTATRYVKATLPAGLKDVVSIAAGHHHSVALKRDGTVVAWGSNYNGQTSVPPDLGRVVAIAAGGAHTLALKPDGSVVWWGYGSNYFFSQARLMAGGSSHSLVLKEDGSVQAYGANNYGQCHVPADLGRITALAGGGEHSLAVRLDGTVAAWGSTQYGATTVPSGLGNVKAVAGGYGHSVALTHDGKVVAWGDGHHGQTTLEPGLSHVTAIAAGYYCTMVAQHDDRDLGAVNLTTTGAPRKLTLSNGGIAPLTIKSIALVGTQSADFLLDKAGLVTRLDAAGSTSISVAFRPKAVGARRATLRITSTDPALPVFDVTLVGVGRKNAAPVINTTTIIAEATSPAGAVVDLTDHSTDEGEVLPLTTTFTPLSGSVFPIGDTTVTVSATDSAGLTTSGSFTVRVQDTEAPVFVSSPADMIVDSTTPAGAVVEYPAAVVTDEVGATVTYSQASGSLFQPGETVVRIQATDAAGHGVKRQFRVRVRAAAIRVVQGSQTQLERGGGKVVAWGDDYNGNGQLRVPATLGQEVKAVAAGRYHSMALKLDGTVVCWGDNSYGKCSVPAGLKPVIAIAAGRDHSVALQEDGTVVAWGSSLQGQTWVPSDLRGVVAIAAGAVHTLALKMDGTVAAWSLGRSYDNGQARVPADLKDVVAIAAGGLFSVALKSDGSVVAWGSDYGRALDCPVGLQGVKAIAAGGQHVLALRQDGTIVAWGGRGTSYNDSYSGYGYYRQAIVPAGLSQVTGIAAGLNDSLALKADGTVVAWGQFSGRASFASVVALDCGDSHALALQQSTAAPVPSVITPVVNVGSTVQAPAFTISNPGEAPLLISDLSLTGDAAADFALNTAAMQTSVPPGGSTTFTVAFTPSAAGTRSATIRLVTNAKGTGTFELPISGTGKLNTAPVITLAAMPAYREALSPAGGPVSFSATVQDAGEVVLPTVIFSHASGSVFPIGDTTVTASTTDSGGLTTTREFVVTVRDTLAPAIAAPPTVLTRMTQADGAVVTYPPATVTDAVGVTSVTYSHPSGSLFPPGINTVTVTAQDAAGNVRTSAFGVRVGVIYQMPYPPIIAEAIGPGGAVVTFSLPLNYGGSVAAKSAPVVTPPSGSLFPLGETEVTATAQDSSGFSNTTRFIVRVRDTIAPQLVALPNLEVICNQADGAARVTYPPATATDTVGVTSITYSHPSGTVFPVGKTTVTVTAKDAAENTTAKTFTVTVTPPRLVVEKQQSTSWVTVTGVGHTLDFGMAAPGGSATHRLRFSHPDGGMLTGLRVEITDTLNGNFALDAEPPATLAEDEQAEVVVRYTPTATGLARGELRIYTSASPQPVLTMALKGLSWRVPNLTVVLSPDIQLQREPGQVITWGLNTYQQQHHWSNALGEAQAVAAANDTSMALTAAGTVVSWGASAPLNQLTGVQAIGMLGYQSWALKRDGAVVTTEGSYSQPSGYEYKPAGLADVVGVAQGTQHYAALKEDGTVVCWGMNDKGQRTVPVGLANVFSIAAAGTHTLALKGDGTVVAWGQNSYGAATVPAGLADVIAISTGEKVSAAVLADGTTVYWGETTTPPPPGKGGKSVGTGKRATGKSTISSVNGGATLNLGGFILTSGTGYTYNSYSGPFYLNGHTYTYSTGGTVIIPVTPSAVAPPADLSDLVQQASGTNHTVALKKTWPAVPFGTVNQGQTEDRTFTLRSTGTLDLRQLTATITGPDASQFTLVSTPPPAELAPGGSAEVVVRFTPQGHGARNATLLIQSSDLDEPSYQVKLGATATAPEIQVLSHTGVVVEDGTTVTLGTTALNTTGLNRLLTIKNTGTGTLSGLSATVEGEHAGEFIVTPMTSATLTAGQTQTLAIRFAPAALGPRTATLLITSDDADEAAYDLVLTGRGSQWEATFAGAGGALVERPSQALNLGTIDTGTPVERSFTLRNPGSTPLTGLRVEIEGADAAQVTVTPPLPTTLAPGESFTFTVRFTAKLGGARNALVRVLTDQVDDEPLVLRLDATVLAAQLRVSCDSLIYEPEGSRTVNVWGWNEYGQRRVPAGLRDAVSVALSNSHVVALKADGMVLAWGNAYSGQTSVPAGLKDVTAIAAGRDFSLALKADGTLQRWGYTGGSATIVPAGLSQVASISARSYNSIALRRDGTVVSWGSNVNGENNVPTGLNSVVAVSAGANHTLALKSDGTVVAWGDNSNGQTTVPTSLGDVVAISAGDHHSTAVKRDGTIVAWGYTPLGQATPPAGLGQLTALAAGAIHTSVLTQAGTVVGWGVDSYGQVHAPPGLSGATAIAASAHDTAAVADPVPLSFGTKLLWSTGTQTLVLTNTGTLPLMIRRITLEGPDADQFRLPTSLPSTLAINANLPLSLTLTPTRIGSLRAKLRIECNDPTADPYVINLLGTSLYYIEAGNTASSSDLKHGSLTLDGQTGLVLQKLTFANPTGVPLHGLRILLSGLATGVTMPSSSASEEFGFLEIIYSKPIAAGETIQFTLAYSDPKRRTSSAVQPNIMAISLAEPEPVPGPVSGTLVTTVSVRDTTSGPLLEWASSTGVHYVVEYSDDAGVTWSSAVHLLTAKGTRMAWVDRGQPETFSKPVNKAARKYRVKRL